MTECILSLFTPLSLLLSLPPCPLSSCFLYLPAGIKTDNYTGHFFLRSPDLLSAPIVDSDKTYSLELDNDETPIEYPFISIQTAILYAFLLSSSPPPFLPLLSAPIVDSGKTYSLEFDNDEFVFIPTAFQSRLLHLTSSASFPLPLLVLPLLICIPSFAFPSVTSVLLQLFHVGR